MKPKLYDQYGRPIDLKALKEVHAHPETTSVRQVNKLHPSAGLTPQSLSNIMKQAEETDPRNYLALAEDMEEKEPQYFSVLGTRKRAVAQLDITVEPASDDANDIANAELLEEFVNRDCIQDEILDILDSVGKGFSVCEIIWDMSESQWMPCALEYVEPTWFEFDRLTLKTPLLKGSGGAQPLAPYKFITHFSKAKSGIPMRGGLARVAAWSYLFKNFGVKSWVTLGEVYGQPIRVGKYHDGATNEEKFALLQAVSNIGTDAAAIMPSTMELEFIKAETKSGGDFHKVLCQYFDHQISKIVLGQTTTTDAVSGGHAVSKEHNEVRGDIRVSDTTQLVATLNRDLVRPFIDLNRGPQKRYPRILMGVAEEINKDEIEAIDKMIGRGLKVTQRQMRAKLGIEDASDDEELLMGKPLFEQAGPGENKTALNSQVKSTNAAEPETSSDQDAVDELAQEMDADWEEVLAPIVNPVREFVEGAGSLEEIRDGLVDHIQDMDETALQTKLSRAGFTIRTAANLGADSDDEPDQRDDG